MRHAREHAAAFGHHHQALLDQVPRRPGRVIARPMYSISPPAAGWVPVIAFSVVVLPAPLAPIRLTSSPSLDLEDRRP